MSVVEVLAKTRGSKRLHWTDYAAYAYLAIGVVLMFGPVVWLALSSFKTQAGLLEFPPTLLPMSQKEVVVQGYDKPLPLYASTANKRDWLHVLDHCRAIELVLEQGEPC